MLRDVVQRWTRIFGSYLPAHMDKLARGFKESLNKFHGDALKTADKDIIERKRIPLNEAWKTRSRDTEERVRGIETQTRAEQRDVNRIFVETIAQELGPAYEDCAKMQGTFLF